MAKIRVIIIDDSAIFREFLKRSFEGDTGLDVVGTFGDPLEAMNHIRRLQPDVMTVDMEMPKMRGNEFMRNVLPRYPHLRAVVISSLNSNVFDAMEAGAIDFVGKPGSRPGYDQEQFAREVIRKVKIAAGAKPHANPFVNPNPDKTQPNNLSAGRNLPSLPSASPKSIIAIGASTGGTEAIIDVIRHFPANTPGVVIVQHMPPLFTRMYAERVDKISAMDVREAKHGDRVEQGTILIAPGGDHHMRIKNEANGYSITLTQSPKVNGHCPSVDVLFESVAKIAGSHAIGVILTGMGADGARNIKMMRDMGAHTIGQDEESCVVYGMPKVAYDLGGISEQLPLSAIGQAVLRNLSR